MARYRTYTCHKLSFYYHPHFLSPLIYAFLFLLFWFLSFTLSLIFRCLFVSLKHSHLLGLFFSGHISLDFQCMFKHQGEIFPLRLFSLFKFFSNLIVIGVFFLGYLGFGLPLKDISFLLLNFRFKLFYTFFPSIFHFLQQPVVEWIFVHIHRMFKQQGEIFSFLCPHGCSHCSFFC